MKTGSNKPGFRLSPEGYPLWGKYAWLAAVFLTGFALFHPIFMVVGGVIGALTFAIANYGGVVLGPRGGMVYGFLTGVGFIPWWIYEYGVSLPDNISAPFISMGIGWAGGWARQLVLKIKDQAETLKETKLELMQAEKMALFGEAAAGVAHEINQPLAIIGLAVEKAQLNLKKGKSDTIPELLQTIREQVKRAGQIVYRLKSTSQNLEDEEKKLLDFNEIVRKVLDQFETQMQALGIDLNVSLSPTLPILNCRAGSIQQMLVYLLLNARDAVSESMLKSVEVNTYERNGDIVLEIADSGVGMSNETMKRIFDPFFTTKEIGEGSGLGLPICYRIVSDHGGTIDVTSELKLGSRFEIILPPTSPEPKISSPLPATTPSEDREATKIASIPQEAG